MTSVLNLRRRQDRANAHLNAKFPSNSFVPITLHLYRDDSLEEDK